MSMVVWLLTITIFFVGVHVPQKHVLGNFESRSSCDENIWPAMMNAEDKLVVLQNGNVLRIPENARATWFVTCEKQ